MRRKKGKKRKPAPSSYQERHYRSAFAATGLIASHLTVRETDLCILAPRDVREQAIDQVLFYRGQLENYIAGHPAFLSTFHPLAMDPLAPPIVKSMLEACAQADVGPMAAVAGAVAEFVGRALLRQGLDEIIVENGGDVFMLRLRESVAAIYAGTSPLSNKVGVKIPQALMPLGVCTSSGTIGHSVSFGQADSVTVLAPSVSLADAVATRLGNEMKGAADMNRTLEIARSITGLIGVVIVQDNQLGAWGEIELISLNS